MSAVDKNQAIIDFIVTCPQIASNPLFFNAIKAEDENKEVITIANDRVLNTPFIDGSVQKLYSFSIVDFRSVSYDPVPKTFRTGENVDELLDVQGIIDWFDEQNDALNFPDFGSDCVIDSMVTTSDMPNLNGIDESVMPALAKYSITIQIEYLDTSKQIFK